MQLRAVSGLSPWLPKLFAANVIRRAYDLKARHSRACDRLARIAAAAAQIRAIRSMNALSANSKRPPLIWFTQILIILFALLFALFLIAELVGLQQLKETYRNAIWAIVEAVSIHAILLACLVLLFVGLVRRRRWAWWGSIVFAACLLGLLVASHLHPSGPIPILPIPPKQLLGAGIAEVALLVLLVIYPLRLFFSQKVRQFFNIPTTN